MAHVPDRLTLEKHRDLEGTTRVPWPRRIILAAIAVFALLGLLNVFGQRPATAVASSPAAQLRLYAPERVRGGILFTARFHIVARRDVKDAFLILDPGWLEGMAVNTIEPSPIGEASSDGRLTLELGHIPQGSSHILFMQFQVNPTNIAWRRPANVVLADGKTPLLTIHHHYTIYP